MKLWTVQDEQTIKELDKTGVFVCNPEKSTHIEDFGFKNPYDWLSKQMKQQLKKSHTNISYPVWAWQKYDNKTKLDKRVSYIRHLPQNTYIIHLEIPAERIVLSDFDNWHYVLNNIAYREDEYENTHISWSDSLTAQEKEETWKNIFNVEKSRTVQATFWELRKDDILHIEKI